MQNLKIANDTFFVLDLDRTLLNTSLVFNIFQNVLYDRGYEYSEKLNDARKELEATGGSFDVFGFIKSQLSSQQFKETIDAFRKKSQEADLLNEGAHEFLEYLNDNGIDFGILTYGSLEWQQEKIRVSGLDNVPAIIIPNKGKGELIRTWYQKETNIFKVPVAFGVGSYRHLILIDDKAVEHTGLPHEATGILYRPNDDVLPSQAGETHGDNIHTVRSFHEAVEYISSSL